jgi:hypothetical protein
MYNSLYVLGRLQAPPEIEGLKFKGASPALSLKILNSVSD